MHLFPRVVWIELGLLVAGLLLLMFGVNRDHNELVVLSGLCFAGIGLLALSEQRRTLAGKAGEPQRRALGRARIRIWALRAWTWLAVGVVLTAWALLQLR